MPSFLDQPLCVGDGVTSAFQLCKYYGSGSETQQRLITRPVAGSISVGVDGVAVSGWSHLGKGVIAFDEASAEGTVLTAGFRFDVPVRFAEYRLDVSRNTFAAGEADRKRVVEGKGVTVSIVHGGRTHERKNNRQHYHKQYKQV